MSESWPISESLPCGNPHCSQRFESPQDVVEHLNDIYSTCAPFPTLPQVGEASEFDGYQQEYYAQPEAQEPSSVQTNPLGRWAKYHPKSGWLYGESDNTLQQLDQDQFAHRRIHNPYYPFADQDEWKLAKFINETMTLTQADQFLKLGWVRVPFSCLPWPLSHPIAPGTEDGVLGKECTNTAVVVREFTQGASVEARQDRHIRLSHNKAGPSVLA